jgi:predicted LPLAT superfamily acyltransferase
VAEASQHWSRIGESGAVIGMKFLLLVYRLTGRGGFRLCLFPVMLYYYLFRPDARRASQAYLQHIRPLLPAAKRARLSCYRHFLMFGEILLDKILAWMGRIGSEQVLFVDPDIVHEIEVNPGGGIIVVSHLGNFEICNAIAQQIPHLRMTILVYTRHAQKFNTVLRGVSADAEIEIRQVNDLSPAAVMQFAERVRTGGYVVIAGDRTPVTGTQRISEVNFLGDIAPFPQGPFILAGLLRCPVYFLFCLKQQSQYHIHLEKFSERIEFEQRKQRPQVLHDAVQAFADRLQHYCLLAPLQWGNFFPFWRDQRAREPGARR